MDSREDDEMNIYLKVIKTVALKAKRSDTTKKLKAMIREKEGTPENRQELFFSSGGERLKDDHKLVDYGIQTNSTLHLVLQNTDWINLSINVPSNRKTFQLEAKAHETVQNVKFLIQAKEGIQSDCYSLFYGGKLLEDDRSLASLSIQSGSVLYLVFNPRDVLTVSVKMPTGEILNPEVKVLHTICDVKAIIGSMVGFSVSKQILSYAGQRLEDSKTLACYNIMENSILEVSPFNQFQIFVKDCNGKTLALNVRQEDRVTDVKSKIHNKQRVPTHFYYLVFAGKRLEDDKDLASYNIDLLLILLLEKCTVMVTLDKHVSVFQGPTGAPDTRKKQLTTVPASKVPIYNQLRGHLACLRPVKGIQPPPNHHLPFTPLENILNVM